MFIVVGQQRIASCIAATRSRIGRSTAHAARTGPVQDEDASGYVTKDGDLVGRIAEFGGEGGVIGVILEFTRTST
jgi:hypothetical protein